MSFESFGDLTYTVHQETTVPIASSTFAFPFSLPHLPTSFLFLVFSFAGHLVSFSSVGKVFMKSSRIMKLFSGSQAKSSCFSGLFD